MLENNKFYVYSIGILLLLLLASWYYSYHFRVRIAYVRVTELVYGYNGMREAHSKYVAQTEQWQSNVDTLKMQYQRCVSDYQSSYKTLSEAEKVEKQNLIKQLESNLANYSSVVREQAQEKEKALTDAVLNQINSYVEEYAKKKGYNFIIGNTNGNLIYGDKAYDITNEVLAALNKEYKILPASATEEK